MYRHLNTNRVLGFTLIEVVVVVGIVAILASVVGFNALESGREGRDAKRQSDLRALQSAIELYKNKNGRYPSQCPQANPGAADGWSGQIGTDYACADGSNNYIQGLAPEFIPVLPVEKKLNGRNSGYVYRSDGSVYKIKAQRTVEADVIDYTHQLKACDIRVPSNSVGSLVSGARNRETIGWCGRVDFDSDSLPLSCRTTDPQWSNSYALWGGFNRNRPLADTCIGPPEINCRSAVVSNTTDIICR